MRTKYARKLSKDWDGIAEAFNALGDSMRQRILLLFEPGEEIGIKQISDFFDCCRTTIVHHLTVLERAQLIARRKEGKEVYFRINKSHLVELLRRVLGYIEDSV